MRRFLTVLLYIAWPPYRRHVKRDRAWRTVLNAGLHLVSNPDWDRGDCGAGRILGQKLRELNG